LFTLTEARAPEHPRDRLSTTERQVLDAVPVVQGVPARKIAKTAGLSLSGTHEALLVLLRTGLVEHALGRWRLVREETA
jgi:DNA processing protein